MRIVPNSRRRHGHEQRLAVIQKEGVLHGDASQLQALVDADGGLSRFEWVVSQREICRECRHLRITIRYEYRK